MSTRNKMMWRCWIENLTICKALKTNLCNSDGIHPKIETNSKTIKIQFFEMDNPRLCFSVYCMYNNPLGLLYDKALQ